MIILEVVSVAVNYLDKGDNPCSILGMRFTAHGPSIPDDLLLAHDRGEVVFFCGAGVSQARAGLSNFQQLARKVMGHLGPAKESPARKLLELATTLDPIQGVGSFVATDRVFSLLEREFDTTDIHAAVASALKPRDAADLSAHELVLDLAGRRSGAIRLVTTNFDRLFESCDPSVRSIGPAHLPDPRRADLNAVVHLHGRVDAGYLGSDHEGFVLSSGEFGRAYLADGWAARFIQSLLSRFSIVFLGYSADDPPVQYLLEALKGASQTRGRMYAFQPGESAVASSLWENKGVHAMAYDPSDGHKALWSTLEAWVNRINDVDGWHDSVLKKAARGPEGLHPHERGQVAHILSSAEGVRRVTQLPDGGIPASWLRVIDPSERYGQPERDSDSSDRRLDPFDQFGLDDDAPPPPPDPREDELSYMTRPRDVPKESWGGFDLYPGDSSAAVRHSGILHGRNASMADPLPNRLDLLAIWLMKVAHQPSAFSWALKQPDLHPRVKALVLWAIRDGGEKFSAEIARGWRYLFRTWDDRREDPDQTALAVSTEANASGWTDEMLRQLMRTRRPRLRIEAPLGIRPSEDDRLFSLRTEYPRPHIEVEIPPEMLEGAVARLRENLDYAKSLEAEVHGGDWIYLPTTYETDGQLLDQHAYGLVGPVLEMQREMGRLATVEPAVAHAEFLRWPIDDDGIFARLRIWAARESRITTPEEAAAVLEGLSDKAFWGSLHQRDLLMTLSSRWSDFPESARLALERKLTSTSYPYDTPRGPEYNDRALLGRLRWFAGQGLHFSFDVDGMITDLAARLGGKLPNVDDAIEDTQPRVFSVETNNDPAELVRLSIREILSKAAVVERVDYRTHVQHDPFSGLVEHRPIKALAALSYETKNGRIHAEGWGTFLRSEKREQDPARLLHLICARLANMTDTELAQVVHPVADWMKRLARRLTAELPPLFDMLWQNMVKASAAIPALDSERYSERNWADDGLNRPVGKLTQVLLQDPSLSGRHRNSGLETSWKAKMEALLSLPGDLHRQALVFASFRFVFFWLIDPKWAEAIVMPNMESEGPDGDAFWDGFLWASKVPPPPLLRKMRRSIVRRIADGSRRKSITDSLADIVLYAWIEWSERKNPPISNAQFREAIVEGGEQFGVQVLWNLGRRLQKNAVSREKVILFFREVWPLQKTLKSEETSRALSAFLFKTGDLFAEVATLIAGRLVPCEDFDTYTVYAEEPGGIIETFPEALLEILLRLLPSDVSRWPHYTGDILDRLVRAPSIGADARLIHLRRTMGRPAIAPEV
ncbi:SIR2 family protein [Rhizobium sp. S96]|uniref:SIR2 family protein n=1 Tax=Rhizobium sp. S96 TaxID=3055140 RepID=UPI0025AA3D7A|nr:SIR2 family protein [Rhizobium sp. S96]MDM9621093.1 SIR2 family protein [Rhizobium sp. S96]